MNRLASLAFIAALVFSVSAGAEEDSGEEKLRQRFVTMYTSAQTPAAKTEAIALLKGVTEEKSQRLLVGMLGDGNEAVRKAACDTIAGTPDKSGYFVKPLGGALTDKSLTVRVAAADALSHADIKAEAVKALAFALHALVAEKNNEANAPVVKAYDAALSKLSGKQANKTDPRDTGTFWLDYWKQNEEALRADDEKKLAVAPKSREGLAPDSFDQKK